MSRISVMYIEYRKNDKSPWRWIRPLMPSQDIDWAENDQGYMVDINGTDNKEQYKFVYELSKQGSVRDLFNDNDVDFNDWIDDVCLEIDHKEDKNKSVKRKIREARVKRNKHQEQPNTVIWGLEDARYYQQKIRGLSK